MNINIETKNLDITPSLRIYIEKKFSSFTRILERFEKNQVLAVWLELERVTRHHKKGDVFRAEVILHLPKKLLRAEGEFSNLRGALDIAKNKLKVELAKYKSQISKKRVKSSEKPKNF